jgi:hypothetical protein
MNPLAVSKRLVSVAPLCLVLRRVWVEPVNGTTDTSQAVDDLVARSAELQHGRRLGQHTSLIVTVFAFLYST